jgi:hypothetical protein
MGFNPAAPTIRKMPDVQPSEVDAKRAAFDIGLLNFVR